MAGLAGCPARLPGSGARPGSCRLRLGPLGEVGGSACGAGADAPAREGSCGLQGPAVGAGPGPQHLESG